jgi:hypothetical protein
MNFQLTLCANRYPTGVAEDSRTAYMRLVLWAAAAKATATFYGLDPSDDDFQWQQLLLRSRSQQLLGAGTYSLSLPASYLQPLHSAFYDARACQQH